MMAAVVVAISIQSAAMESQRRGRLMQTVEGRKKLKLEDGRRASLKTLEDSIGKMLSNGLSVSLEGNYKTRMYVATFSRSGGKYEDYIDFGASCSEIMDMVVGAKSHFDKLDGEKMRARRQQVGARYEGLLSMGNAQAQAGLGSLGMQSGLGQAQCQQSGLGSLLGGLGQAQAYTVMDTNGNTQPVPARYATKKFNITKRFDSPYKYKKSKKVDGGKL